MFEQAINLDSNFVNAINALGRSYHFANDYDKAEEMAKDVIER